MGLRNFKIRIKAYPEGWAVEVQKSYFFGMFKYWTHLLGAAGMEHEPYHFQTFNSAMEVLLRDVEFEISTNSQWERNEN